MHRTFIYRQITSSLKQTLVFVACVALSLVTLVSLGGFGESVNNALLRDARKLLAGDIVVESQFPFEQALVDFGSARVINSGDHSGYFENIAGYPGGDDISVIRSAGRSEGIGIFNASFHQYISVETDPTHFMTFEARSQAF